ncbi:MAG TPA: hypothetical protein VFC34_14850, partial [Puia sp.]|nr:hypothetical protein [Puia sp.]
VCNAMPLLYFVDLDQFIKNDAADKIYDLVPMIRPKDIKFQPAGYYHSYSVLKSNPVSSYKVTATSKDY